MARHKQQCHRRLLSIEVDGSSLKYYVKVEGSVRKAGNRVRVTAQLVK